MAKIASIHSAERVFRLRLDTDLVYRGLSLGKLCLGGYNFGRDFSRDVAVANDDCDRLLALSLRFLVQLMNLVIQDKLIEEEAPTTLVEET